MIYKTLILLAATLLAATAHAQPGDIPQPLAARLDSALGALRARHGITGVSASIVSARLGTWTGAAGIADVETGEPVRGEMLFGIGSVTKTYTSALVLKLVEEGRLSLDDTTGRWFRGRTNIPPSVTVRQLLSHTSGIASYTDSDAFWGAVFEDLDRYVSPDEILTYVGPPSFAPGAAWEYSNTNYVLLGMIVEQIDGIAFEESLGRLLASHDLRAAAMGSLDTLPGTASGNHIDIDGDGDLDNLGAYPRRSIYSGAWAAGGLYAPIEEVARWGSLLYGGRILSPAAMSELTTFRAIPNFGTGGGYGLGVMRLRALGRTIWGHTGGIPGFSTALWHFPADSLTVAVAVNEESDATSAIALALAQIALQFAPTSVVLEQGIGARAARPNPFTTSTTIGIESREAATVRIHDLSGRLVRTIVDDRRGVREVVWDGLDDEGRAVAARIYLARIGDRTVMLTKAE